MPLLCNRCFRTTAEDRDNCPNNGDQFLPCPEPVEVSDDKVVVIKCAACPKVRAIPIGNIMQRRRLNELGPCVSDQCKAEVVLPAVTRPRVLPPLLDMADIGGHYIESAPPVITGQQLSDMSAEVGLPVPPVAAQPAPPPRTLAQVRRAKRGKRK